MAAAATVAISDCTMGSSIIFSNRSAVSCDTNPLKEKSINGNSASWNVIVVIAMGTGKLRRVIFDTYALKFLSDAAGTSILNACTASPQRVIG